MDNFKYDFEKEYEDVIEEVSHKFKYNDDLKTVLLKITKSALEGKSYEERTLFFKMLRTTPILVIPQEKKLSHEEIMEKMMGDVNPHIKDKEELDQGEYGKQEAAGAFVTSPIIDEDLKLVGVKKFLYITAFDTSGELTENKQKFVDRFHTGINVPHLIHELGHAWASEEKPYTLEDGILTQRMGTVENKYEITDLGNGQYESRGISSTGIFIEEGLNTNFEEQTVARFLGISLEEAKKLYLDGTITPSAYQPGISSMTEYLSNNAFKADLSAWRIFGNKVALENLNKSFAKANFYEKREKLYFRNEMMNGDGQQNIIVARNALFNSPKESEEAVKAMQSMEDVFFPDSTNMTPMQMMDNILQQHYDAGVNKYRLGLENYTEMLKVIAREGYGLINQATQIHEQEKGKEAGAKGGE